VPSTKSPADECSLLVDTVAKLGGRRLARNNRIVAIEFLNGCCALVAVLESMLPAQAPKIALQQNRQIAEGPIIVEKVHSSGLSGGAHFVFEMTRMTQLI